MLRPSSGSPCSISSLPLRCSCWNKNPLWRRKSIALGRTRRTTSRSPAAWARSRRRGTNGSSRRSAGTVAARRSRAASPTAAARALQAGDYVVHLEHGIGLYRGIQTIAVGSEGGTLEVAVVEYASGDRLNVPLYRLDQLEPYRAAGNGDTPP